MGLATTATHAIWLVAIMTAGGLGIDGYFTGAEAVAEAREKAEELRRAHLETRFGGHSFCWASGTLRVNVTNAGRLLLEPDSVSFVVDGAPLAGFVAAVDGAPGGKIWPPGAQAWFNHSSVASEPARVMLVAPAGVPVHAPRITCPSP